MHLKGILHLEAVSSTVAKTWKVKKLPQLELYFAPLPPSLSIQIKNESWQFTGTWEPDWLCSHHGNRWHRWTPESKRYTDQNIQPFRLRNRNEMSKKLRFEFSSEIPAGWGDRMSYRFLKNCNKTCVLRGWEENTTKNDSELNNLNLFKVGYVQATRCYATRWHGAHGARIN